MTRSTRFHLLAGLLGIVAPLGARAAAPALTSPEPAVVEEARALVAAMKAAERGPYTRLRWYCNDGSVLPPEPYACRGRGGGRQHAEYSPARARLAELGWSVGTIFAALSWEELWDEDRRHQRLRELPMERFLVEADDGWVLRRARSYRGRVQVEDEEEAGRALLVRLLSQPGWTARNLLLAREAVRAVPHHGGADRTRTIRHLSQQVAE
ncbi:MAG: phosphoenolpyruvate synthase, partial [Thermoanaerobaculia bacterium]|nr:phosphoenolpyruvate synthase [Thermoanaerobaculia bacterium]